MTKRWLEMRLAVPAEAADLVSQLLSDLGSVGVIAAEQKLDTFVVPDPHSLENAPVLRAFFVYPDDPAALEAAVLNALKTVHAVLPDFQLPAITWSELADADWASDWRQHFPPFKVGERLVICPSWAERPEGDEAVLILDPGQAFGTGTHATTGLCLDALAERFAGDNPPAAVLDVGTGSGILAMAAAALGAQRVVACDLDADACRIARENVARNGLSQVVSITDRPLAAISGKFPLLLANILADENIRLGPEFAAHLDAGGALILSGILAEQEGLVRDGFAALPVDLVDVRRRAEWLCMIYHRRHE